MTQNEIRSYDTVEFSQFGIIKTIIARTVNVSENDSHYSDTTQSTVKGSSAGRGESSDDGGMWTEMVLMLRAVVDRSTHEQRRRGTLCRR